MIGFKVNVDSDRESGEAAEYQGNGMEAFQPQRLGAHAQR